MKTLRKRRAELDARVAAAQQERQISEQRLESIRRQVQEDIARLTARVDELIAKPRAAPRKSSGGRTTS